MFHVGLSQAKCQRNSVRGGRFPLSLWINFSQPRKHHLGEVMSSLSLEGFKSGPAPRRPPGSGDSGLMRAEPLLSFSEFWGSWQPLPAPAHGLVLGAYPIPLKSPLRNHLLWCLSTRGRPYGAGVGLFRLHESTQHRSPACSISSPEDSQALCSLTLNEQLQNLSAKVWVRVFIEPSEMPQVGAVLVQTRQTSCWRAAGGRLQYLLS